MTPAMEMMTVTIEAIAASMRQLFPTPRYRPVGCAWSALEPVLPGDGGIVVSIAAFQAVDPGSIPGHRSGGAVEAC